jgi:hypothetical protein
MKTKTIKLTRDQKLKFQAALVIHLRNAGLGHLASKYDTRAIKAARTYGQDARRFARDTSGDRLAAFHILNALSRD